MVSTDYMNILGSISLVVNFAEAIYRIIWFRWNKLLSYSSYSSTGVVTSALICQNSPVSTFNSILLLVNTTSCVFHGKVNKRVFNGWELNSFYAGKLLHTDIV